MSPEVLAQGPIQGRESTEKITPSGPKVDVWSLGIIIMEICLGMELWVSCTLPQLISKVMLLGKHGNGGHPLETILKEHGLQNKYQVKD